MTDILRVLYAEDSVVDADLTRRHLQLNAPHIDLEVVGTGQEFLARLDHKAYDVLLLDNDLPDMDGTEVLKQLALKPVAVPVVMVTGSRDETLVVQVLSLGASDYVPKNGHYLDSLSIVLESAAENYRTRQAERVAAGRSTSRVLYAEHDPADIDLTRRHFAAAAGHFDLHIVQSSADALALLEKEDFDLVLADLRLPDTSALDLLRESNYRNLRVPFIVVTARGDEEAAAAALKLGAYDYIVKGDAYLTQLPYAIDNAISRARLQDSNRRLLIELAERTRAEERIRHLNADLEQRVVQRTRELESANEELEDTAILELIAENAPVSEICTRLASLLARRTNTVVSVTAFPPLDRFRGIRSGASPESPETGSADHTRITSASLASLAIATPDGPAYSTASRHLADASLLETLAAAERLPVHVEFPMRSAVTNMDLGRFTLYREDSRPLDDVMHRTVERCTKLGAIAMHRAHSEERIRRQALEDPLTGVANRLLWSDRLQQALVAAQRHKFLVAVLLYDLDRFKDINDTLGHDVGDRVLRHVAAQLEHAVRPSDTVGRLGGDEFAVVVPAVANVEEAERIALRGLASLEQPLPLDDVMLKPRASVGLAFHPLHGADPLSLLRCADVAMYRAKRLGGGVGVYDIERDHEQLDSVTFVGELQRAIESDQLLLCYQPKISLRTGRMVGVECLVRWRHPTRGLIPPIQFIPVAESVGLIKPLSFWVIRKALQDCESWHERGLDVPVAVNLSAPLLYDPELPGAVREELSEHHIPEGLLEVEITESTLMLDPERAMKTISRLRASGITFALDDFGTGYSSLAYLKNLQVQSIKVDRSFVRDMVNDQRDASIVKAAIELGHSFNLDIVAEGVESLAASDLLTDLGCDHAQGFHIARPMMNDDFLSWHEQRGAMNQN